LRQLKKTVGEYVEQRTGGAQAIAKSAQSERSERHSIQSVDRAITLLEAIAEAGGECSLTELSHRTRLNISTCHHLLSTLVQRGYVAKVPVRRSYALGARIHYLCNASLQVDLPARAAPFIEQINQKTGETVHLAVLQGGAMMKIAKRESRHPVRVDTGTLGKSDAPHATASGKAMRGCPRTTCAACCRTVCPASRQRPSPSGRR
jgi:IclR family acetate operon transcriptional repressor